MKKNLFISLIVISAITFFSLPSLAKVNVSMNEYKLAEVTNDGVNIRSGAGTNFPKAHTMFKDWNGKKTKMEVPQAYKGQRFLVKDAGDWWEIDTPDIIYGDSPRFMLKKYAKLIETDPFDMGSHKEPQVWGYSEIIPYGDDDEVMQVSIVTVYPEGLAITQNYTAEGDVIRIGEVLKDNSAILDRMIVWVGSTGDQVADNSPLKIWSEPQLDPPTLMWQYGEKSKSSFTFNGEKIDYIDVSTIPTTQWIDVIKLLSNSPNYRSIRLYRRNPEAYTLLSDLSKFVRIK